MKKLLVVTLGTLVAVSSLAPAAQARHRRAVKAAPAAAAPMMMMGNPRMDAQGQFYATPVSGPDPAAALLAPLAVPGAVVGGVAEPALAIPADITAGLLPK